MLLSPSASSRQRSSSVHLIKRASLRGDVKPPSIRASRAFLRAVPHFEFAVSIPLDSRRKSLPQIAFADPLLSSLIDQEAISIARYSRDPKRRRRSRTSRRALFGIRDTETSFFHVLCSFFPAFPFRAGVTNDMSNYHQPLPLSSPLHSSLPTRHS